MREIVQDFLLFLRKPDQVEVSLSVGKKLERSLILWGVSFVFIMASIVLLEQVVSLPTLDTEAIIAELGLGVFLFFVLVLAPVFEELLFRWPMRYSLSATIILSIVLFLAIVSGVQWLMESGDGSNDNMYYGVVGVVFVLFTLFWILLRSKSDRMKKAWEHRFPFVFYSFSVIFALIHVFNYEEGFSAIWFLTPLLVFPQFILGLVSGYSRMRFGLPYAMFVHFIHNATVMAIFFIGR